jgi:hypothetical protein
MKYFIGTVRVRDGVRDYREQVCITAPTAQRAQAWLTHKAAHLWGGDGEDLGDGAFGYEQGAYVARAEALQEVSPLTFQELSGPFEVLGHTSKGNLAEEPPDERAKTLARRIGDQLAKRGVKVAHSKLLHAVAASLGETDWQVLVHREPGKSPQAATPPASTEAEYDNLNGKVPGVGTLYRVPVSVDTTMSSLVLARGVTKEEAIEEARRFAWQGGARFTADTESYRGLADHYCPDDSDDGVFQVDDPLSVNVVELEDGAACGPYVVRLTALEEEDTLLWADLQLRDQVGVETEVWSCQSACEQVESPVRRQQFCRRVVELLCKAAPDPGSVDEQLLRSVFIDAVQGDQSDEAFAALAYRFGR